MGNGISEHSRSLTKAVPKIPTKVLYETGNPEWEYLKVRATATPCINSAIFIQRESMHPNRRMINNDRCPQHVRVNILSLNAVTSILQAQIVSDLQDKRGRDGRRRRDGGRGESGIGVGVFEWEESDGKLRG